MFGIQGFEWVTRAVTRVAGLALFTFAARPVSAQNLVNFGDVITEPGLYFLNGNQSGPGNGVVIDSDDVVLFMGRFTLSNTNPVALSDASLVGFVGIVCFMHDHVAVIGGRMTGFSAGAYFFECSYCTVKDTRFDHNGGAGLLATHVDHSAFVRVRTDQNLGDGFRGEDLDDSRLFSVRSDGNGENGIYLALALPEMLGEWFDETTISTGNTIKKCWLAYNGKDGLHVVEGDNNEFLENQCVANDRGGILLEGLLDFSLVGGSSGADGNRIEGNWCPWNGVGIEVAQECTGNELVENIALASFVFDAFDDNPLPCQNTWVLNTVITRGGDGAFCIF